MDIHLSKRVQSIKPSPTLAVTAKAKELKAQGKDIVGLGAGEPDFDTPDHIKDAAIQAIRDGQTKYTAVDGTPELKNAVIAKFQRDNGLDYQGSEVLVSCGGKQSFYNLAQALLNPGDEVLIPAPYWVSYPDMVLLAGAVPVFLSTGLDRGFKVTPTQLERSITASTRLVVLNSPSNPAGTIYTRADWEALGEVLRRHPQVLIATDDIYEHIWWADEPFSNIAMACPDLKDRTIVLNGVSKAYSMTGWRIGYAAGPERLIQAMKKIQSQSTSNPASISQAAAVAALEGDQSCIGEMVTAFKQRHDFIVDALNGLQGVRCIPSQGAFYAFPDMGGAVDAVDGVRDDVGLADHFLEHAGVALVPGSAFGMPGYMRLSFATGMDTLQDALERMAGVLGKA